MARLLDRTFLIAVALAAAACSSPIRTPSPPLESVSTSPTSVVSISTAPSAPVGVVTANIPLTGLAGLAPSSEGVWYVRAEATGGWIGRAASDGSSQESEAGPAPVAVSASSDALYVLEGVPTYSYVGGRTNVVERLDPKTLAVVASVAVPGLGTDLTVASGKVWVVTAQGQLVGYDEPDLAQSLAEQLPGRGDARVVAGDDVVWVLGERVNGPETVTLLTRLDVATNMLTTTEVKGGPALSLSVGTSGTWIGTGSETPGSGMLYPFDGDRFGSPLSLPTPVALANSPGGVWWAAADGRVGLSDGRVANVGSPVNAGTGAVDITSSNSLVWVAEDSLVAIRPHE